MSHARSFGRLPWPSKGARGPEFIPLKLYREKARGWYWKNNVWLAQVNLSVSGSPADVGEVLLFMNRTNYKGHAGLVLSPSSEIQLPKGWCIDYDGPLSISGRLLFLLFSDRLTDGSYGGAEYEAAIDSQISPFIDIAGSVGGTSQTGFPLEPAVTVLLDGESIPYYAPAGVVSGTISIIPLSYWPYEGKYDPSTGAKLIEGHYSGPLV